MTTRQVIFTLALLGVVLAGGCGADRSKLAEDSDKAFEEGADRKPSAQTLLAMAKILASQGRDADCVAVLKRIQREEPKFMPAYYEMAEAQMRLQRPEEAKAALEAGLRIDPRSAMLWNNLGMCRLLEDQYAPALESFFKASRLEPGSSQYRANAALAMAFLGRYDEALALYQHAMPEAEAHYNVAIVCLARRDGARGEAEFQMAYRMNPRLPPRQGLETAPAARPTE